LAATAAVALVLAVPPSGAALTPPPLSASAAVLVAANTGQELDGLKANAQVPIASATKLMTALITLERVPNLDRTFADPNYYFPPADSQIGLVPGERMTVRDLLVAMMLPSADDAATDLAYNVGRGSVARFIGMMNARARQLGLRHTHYSTPVGLDTPGNYSSASDLVKLGTYLLAHEPVFRHVVALRSAVLHSGDHRRYVVNRNDLVARYPWINGIKTGHTVAAGYVLVASANWHGLRLLSAVLGTSSTAARDENTLALLNWGYRNFHFVTPLRAGEVLARPTVSDRPGFHALLLTAGGYAAVLPKDARLRLRIVAPHNLTGPLERHAVVGYVVVLADRRPLARIRLLLADRLPAVSGLTIAARFITRPVTLFVVLALLGLAAALIFRRRVHGGASAPRR
jgi:D-alanyl-D-alanine carboxypeptidase (penicillin-binding protein 5/6)